MRRIHFDETDSTSGQARRLAAQHPGEPLLVTAAVQTAGRGSQGRAWQSPPGGAWLSVVWPTRQPPAAYRAVSLAAAVAVRRAVVAALPAISLQLRIKWPNDLLLAERKVAGILCEHVPGESTARPGCLIVGVGVNVDFDLALLPADLRHPPTTLAAVVGRPVVVESVVEAVAAQLVAALREFDADGLSATLRAELQDHFAYVGAERTCETPRGAVTGRVLGVDDAGRLLLGTSNGAVACDTGELSA